MIQKKMTQKQWCKEFAPDMGYRFQEMRKSWKHYKYYLYRRGGRTFGFDTISEVQNHILRDIQKYIGKHTKVVRAQRKK